MNYKTLNDGKTGFDTNFNMLNLQFNDFPEIYEKKMKKKEKTSYQLFLSNIKYVAINLNQSFNNADNTEILLSLKSFENVDYYKFASVNEYLEKEKTYNILVDIIDIDPDAKFSIQENFGKDNFISNEMIVNSYYALAVILIFSYSSTFAISYFDKLNFIDKFLANSIYFPSSSICFGLNAISNIIIELDIDKREKYLNKHYFNAFESFLQRENKHIYESVLFLIRNFCHCISQHIIKEQINITHQTARERVLRKIHHISNEQNEVQYVEYENFLNFSKYIVEQLYNYVIIIQEEFFHYLINSLYFLCKKYVEITQEILNSKREIPFISHLSFSFPQNIEETIHLFDLFFEQNQNENEKIKIIMLIKWMDLIMFILNNIKSSLNEKTIFEIPNWVMVLLKFALKISNFLYINTEMWNLGFYPVLISSFDIFPSKYKNEICFLLANVIFHSTNDLTFQMINCNLLSVFFSCLEADNIEIHDQVLNCLHVINEKANESNQMDKILAEYNEKEAESIFNGIDGFEEKIELICREVGLTNK